HRTTLGAESPHCARRKRLGLPAMEEARIRLRSIAFRTQLAIKFPGPWLERVPCQLRSVDCCSRTIALLRKKKALTPPYGSCSGSWVTVRGRATIPRLRELRAR